MCKVICITNRKLCGGDFTERIERVASAHPAAIILREKDISPSEYAALAEKVLKICSRYGTPCVLHGFIEEAEELGAKAIHLPLEKLKNNADLVQKFEIVGCSCHSVEDALEAERLGCKYVIAGHIFPTECKKGVPARGLEFLRGVCSAVNIPVFAIGGINADNAARAIAAGAAGVCSMSGFMTCEDPDIFIKELGELNG